MGQVVVLSGAEADALSIYSQWQDSNEAKANRFSNSIDLVIRNLGKFPEIGSPFLGRYRRCLVPKFPEYGVYYTMGGSRVIVHAILNQRQGPESILKRLDLDD